MDLLISCYVLVSVQVRIFSSNIVQKKQDCCNTVATDTLTKHLPQYEMSKKSPFRDDTHVPRKHYFIYNNLSVWSDNEVLQKFLQSLSTIFNLNFTFPKCDS